MGVCNEGVLVANTGSRFDLFDTQVEDAVTMIGETGKGDDDDQSIGHKGVGLKSILATGDAFEIYTRPDPDADDIFGVELSRMYLVASLLSRFGHTVDIDELAKDVADADLTTLITNNGRDEPFELTDELIEAVSKLPLFNFPVPLKTTDNPSNGIQRRVRELLTESGAGADSPPFRTAVFIRYEDDAWRKLLAEIGASVPDEDEGNVTDRPDRIWRYLSAKASDDGLRPETLVQLGGIDELSLERGGESGSPVSEQWTIERDGSTEVSTSDLSHSDIRVRIDPETDSAIVHAFDQFSFDTPRVHYMSALFNKEQGMNRRRQNPIHSICSIRS